MFCPFYALLFCMVRSMNIFYDIDDISDDSARCWEFPGSFSVKHHFPDVMAGDEHSVKNAVNIIKRMRFHQSGPA